MENWPKYVFLTAALSGSPVALAQGDGVSVDQPGPLQVITADVDRREVRRVSLNTENFEIGPYLGVMSIQDFNTEVAYGLRVAWHITEDFFFEANYGLSQADLTSYEKLSGGAPLFNDSERDYRYYNLNVGWNALPGEIFIGKTYAMKSDFYVIGGAGGTEFLGDNWFTAVVGAGYRLQLADSFALRLEVRDHIFNRDVFGQDETTNNIELSTGITFFF